MSSTIEEPTACIANIGARGRRRRMRIGVAMLALGTCLVAALVASDADRTWRLLGFVPFWAGALGVMQAREKT